MDTWSSGHTSKLYILVCLTQRICLKSLYCGYVCQNQWTHRLLDTQKNIVYLQCTQMIFLENLYGYKCFKPVDTWTFGHRTPQHILLQSSQKFVIFLCLLNKWTHGALDTHQNYIFLFVGLKGFV